MSTPEHDESEKDAARRRGRPQLRTVEEIRVQCVRAGVEAIRSNGLEIDMRGVTIEAAANTAGIPRASSYRAWKRDNPTSPGPQAEFQTAVAVQILSSFVTEQSGVYTLVLELLGEVTGHSDPLEIAAAISAMSAAERQHTFARTVAVGTIANIESVRGNALFHAQVGLRASLNSQGAPTDDLVEAFAEGERVAATRWIDLYRFMFDVFGMRMKEHYQFEHLALAGAAMSSGLGLKVVSPFLTGLSRPVTDPRSGQQIFDDTEWNLFGVATMGLISEFCEPDPNAPQSTDPSAC